MNEQKDIVFLFGAGASFGAGGIWPENPPLGYQLFDDLEQMYPGSWGRLPTKFKEVFRDNFEDGMGLVYSNLGFLISKLMRDMAVYFIQFRPVPGKSLYCKLIKFLAQKNLLESTLFSTLNYECILEYSLTHQHKKISYPYVNGDENSIPILKLHGSCNMFCSGIEASQGIIYGTSVNFDGGLKPLPDKDKVIEHCLVKSGLAPVMCLFMKGKPLQISPSSIKDIQNEWKEQIFSAKAVFCIGVNPLPEDSHIWDCLATTKAVLNFIGDKGRFDGWVAKYRQHKSQFIAHYFDTGFRQLLNNLEGI
jgi:hypothetical protein